MSMFWRGRDQASPWFRIGRLEVTTVVIVVAAVIAAWLVWVATAQASLMALYYAPALLGNGEVWRIFSWPFAEGIGLWTVLNLFMFWYFGSEIEGQIGRSRMAWLLVGMWASLTLTYTALASLFDWSSVLAGMGTIELMVLLLWIAEWPDRKFFFNIPAWVFGLVIVAIDVLGMAAAREWTALLALVISLALVAMLARRLGLLGEYAWIPGRPRARKPKAPKATRGQARQARRNTSDQERLDALLDQISDQGLQSLTEAQRKELKRLSDRRRNR